MSYYYNVFDDINKYPDAWCIAAVGGRNTGKTYGALKGSYERHESFVFTKRTNRDIDLLCSGSGQIGTKKNQYGMDVSPFRSINRDIGTNIKPFKLFEGFGGFWECCKNEKGEEVPEDNPIGRLVSLSSVAKFAGFDMSDAKYLIIDEFIPRPWEKISRLEGEQMMDLYKTVSRDRIHRGEPPLKLILLANPVNVACPITNTLEITDIIANMDINDIEYTYLEERGILIHKLHNNEAFDEVEHKDPVYNAMKNTAWGQMAFENSFSFNDFSALGKTQMKSFKPVCSFTYKYKDYYIYQRDGKYVMCFSKFNASKPHYDLKRETEQKKFYLEYAIDLRNESINGNMIFETYTMYDLITNYHKIFTLR